MVTAQLPRIPKPPRNARRRRFHCNALAQKSISSAFFGATAAVSHLHLILMLHAAALLFLLCLHMSLVA